MTRAEAVARADKAAATVEEKGRQAALAGAGPEACPYPDHRTYHGAVTFSRAWRRAWQKGYNAGLVERIDRDLPHANRRKLARKDQS